MESSRAAWVEDAGAEHFPGLRPVKWYSCGARQWSRSTSLIFCAPQFHCRRPEVWRCLLPPHGPGGTESSMISPCSKHCTAALELWASQGFPLASVCLNNGIEQSVGRAERSFSSFFFFLTSLDITLLVGGGDEFNYAVGLEALGIKERLFQRSNWMLIQGSSSSLWSAPEGGGKKRTLSVQSTVEFIVLMIWRTLQGFLSDVYFNLNSWVFNYPKYWVLVIIKTNNWLILLLIQKLRLIIYGEGIWC